jgi:hypothetical protein
MPTLMDILAQKKARQSTLEALAGVVVLEDLKAKKVSN